MNNYIVIREHMKDLRQDVYSVYSNINELLCEGIFDTLEDANKCVLEILQEK